MSKSTRINICIFDWVAPALLQLAKEVISSRKHEAILHRNGYRRPDRHYLGYAKMKEAQTVAVAALSAALAVFPEEADLLDPYQHRDDRPAIFDGSMEPKAIDPGLRRICLIPGVANRESQRWQASLIAGLERHPRGSFARFVVVTGGSRVSVSGIAKRAEEMRLKIRELKKKLLKHFQIEIVADTMERPRSSDGSYHIHFNLILIPHRQLLPSEFAGYLACLRDGMQAHVRDCGPIGLIDKLESGNNGNPKIKYRPRENFARAVAYVVKYAAKGDVLAHLPPAEILELARQTRDLRHKSLHGSVRKIVGGAKKEMVSYFAGAGDRIYAIKKERRMQSDSPCDDTPGAKDNLLIKLGFGPKMHNDSCVFVPRVVILNPNENSENIKALSRFRQAKEWIESVGPDYIRKHEPDLWPEYMKWRMEMEPGWDDCKLDADLWQIELKRRRNKNLRDPYRRTCLPALPPLKSTLTQQISKPEPPSEPKT